MQFVKGKSDLANDPVFSLNALRREWRRHDAIKEGKGKIRNRAGSFATGAIQEHRPTTTCPLCEKAHTLNKCPEFKRKGLGDRKFIKTKGSLLWLPKIRPPVCQLSTPTNL